MHHYDGLGAHLVEVRRDTPTVSPVTTPSTSPRRGAERVLAQLVELPGVASAVEEAREACTQLRWHQALRRRIPEAAAESRVRGARASALLDGADLPLTQVRDLMRGAAEWPGEEEPVVATVRGAVQVTAEADHLRQPSASPTQVLARLHVAAGTPLLPAEQVGRPRQDGEEVGELVEVGPLPDLAQLRARLQSLSAIVDAEQSAPALLVAAIAHAEIATLRPFVRGNALVARAFERMIIQQRGLDPTGVSVPEAGHHRGGTAEYAGSLAAYAQGTPEGVGLWLQHCAGAVLAGAGEGVRIADAVLAGRLTR